MRQFLFALIVATHAWSAQPGFDVASIKPNTTPDFNGTFSFTAGGRFRGENIGVRFLISTAYHVRDFQLSGVPGWADSAKYDIEAKGLGNPSEEQLIAMLRGLLEDRFKLTYHKTTKEGPVYALLPAKGGIKLKESNEGPCASPDPDKQDPVVCNSYFTRRNQIDAKGVTMDSFAVALATQLDRPVVDKTGFSKRFDAHLEFAPTEVAADAAGNSTGQSIFTAIQEQSGLKLVPQKGPVEYFVVDNLEKPGEN